MITMQERRTMDPQPETIPDLPGRYNVRTRFHHHGDLTEDLSYPEAIELIRERFEKSNGATHFASIERQE